MARIFGSILFVLVVMTVCLGFQALSYPGQHIDWDTLGFIIGGFLLVLFIAVNIARSRNRKENVATKKQAIKKKAFFSIWTHPNRMPSSAKYTPPIPTRYGNCWVNATERQVNNGLPIKLKDANGTVLAQRGGHVDKDTLLFLPEGSYEVTTSRRK